MLFPSIYFYCTYILCTVILSEHVAFIKRLSTLLCVEGCLVQHHAALLTRGHLIAEGAVVTEGKHCS